MAANAAKLRTVVIDDSTELRELLAVALEESGRFDVVGMAGDGAGGVEVAARLQPDLVLLDLAMPGVGRGGLDALPRLRLRAPRSTVVVMSGYPRDDVETSVARRGAAAFVEKGMSLRRFVDRVVAAAGVLETVIDALGASFDEDLRSSSAARHFVSAALERWDCQGALDVVQLLVSELVTNAVVHAHARPNVSVLLLPDAVRVEVADDSSAAVAPREAADDEESGRGMLLLDSMASKWGVDEADGGKTVWFEVPRFDA